jgi:hypothetical protein
MTKNKCVLCLKTKEGRYTRQREPGHLVSHWYCYTCLPAGLGSDESKDTMTPKMTPKKATVLPATVETVQIPKERGELLVLIPTLTTEVAELEVTTAEEYAYADSLLGRVQSARKVWAPIWARIMEKSVKPIRDGLEGLYQMNRDVDGPLEKLELAVKKPMKAFKENELRRLVDEQRAKDREQQRLMDEAEAKRRAAELAKTPQMRGKLLAQAEQQEEQAEVVERREVAAPITAENSSNRKKRAVKVGDLHTMLKGIIDGYVPADCILVNQVKLNAYFREHGEDMALWPGLETFDDIQIVGR